MSRSCVCSPPLRCQHHASGGWLALLGWAVLGFAVAAMEDRWGLIGS